MLKISSLKSLIFLYDTIMYRNPECNYDGSLLMCQIYCTYKSAFNIKISEIQFWRLYPTIYQRTLMSQNRTYLYHTIYRIICAYILRCSMTSDSTSNPVNVYITWKSVFSWCVCIFLISGLQLLISPINFQGVYNREDKIFPTELKKIVMYFSLCRIFIISFFSRYFK